MGKCQKWQPNHQPGNHSSADQPLFLCIEWCFDWCMLQVTPAGCRIDRQTIYWSLRISSPLKVGMWGCDVLWLSVFHYLYLSISTSKNRMNLMGTVCDVYRCQIFCSSVAAICCYWFCSTHCPRGKRTAALFGHSGRCRCSLPPALTSARVRPTGFRGWRCQTGTFHSSIGGQQTFLVGGWGKNPLKNMSSSIGMTSNPIYGKIKNGNQTTNQHSFNIQPLNVIRKAKKDDTMTSCLCSLCNPPTTGTRTPVSQNFWRIMSLTPRDFRHGIYAGFLK